MKTNNYLKTKKYYLSALIAAMLLFLANPLFAQIAQRGSATTAYSASTTLSINMPTGVVDGDLMIANITNDATGGPGTPALAGWTLIDTDFLKAGDKHRGTVLYRIAESGEAGPYNFALTTSQHATGAIIAFSGVSETTPFDATGTMATSKGSGFVSTLTVPGITTVTANAWVILLGQSSDDNLPNFSSWSVATDPTLTENYDFNGTEIGTVGAALGTKSVAGSTGDGTITTDDNTNLGGLLLALRSATACVPPEITVQPTDQQACSGTETATFSLTATGATGYQWQVDDDGWEDVIDGGVYAGATTSTLTITNPPLAMDGLQYRCVVSNACDAEVNSDVVELTVYTPSSHPTGITADPVTSFMSRVCPGDQVRLTVSGDLGDHPDAEWVWYKRGCGLGDPIDEGDFIDVFPDDTTTYYVRAEGGCNMTGCAQIKVWTWPETEITVQPESATIKYGCPIPIFGVKAVGHDLSYQWYINTTESDEGGDPIPYADSRWYQPGYNEVGTYYYYVVVSGTCEEDTSNVVIFTVEPQTAEPVGMLYYTGPNFAFTQNATSNTATVTLSAALKNNHWANCWDGTPTGGDIRTATVSFEVKLGGGDWQKIPSATNLPVGFIDPNDPSKGGTASAIAQINIPDEIGEGLVVDLRVRIGGNYIIFEPLSYTEITIARPLPADPGGKIMGGTWLCNDKSAGYIQGIEKSWLNFEVEYPEANKNGKKAMNPKGRVTLFVLSLNDPTGYQDGDLHLYQITSNAIASLNIDKPNATFTAKSNIVELKFGEMPIPIEGNCVMELDLHQGVPWFSPPWWDPHKVGITIYRSKSKGGIWYSNNWIGAITVRDKICGGWIKVVDGEPVAETDMKSAEIFSDGLSQQLKVYPNPFSDRVMFEFASPTDTYTRIDIFDVTGRLVSTIFDQPVESRVTYQAEFVPVNNVSGMYHYRMTMGNEVFNGKLIYNK